MLTPVKKMLILPSLNQEQIQAIDKGKLSFDFLIRKYIHENLTYRFVETKDGETAFNIEREVKKGHLKSGKPLLNPL
jgi:hypothetical protein